MLHAGLDLSRRRLDICLLDERGEVVAESAVAADADGLRGLAGRLAGRRVRAVIESMNGARFVHDTLEEHGWEVLVADAQKVKGLAPLACKTDRIDARVLAELSWRDLVPGGEAADGAQGQRHLGGGREVGVAAAEEQEEGVVALLGGGGRRRAAGSRPSSATRAGRAAGGRATPAAPPAAPSAARPRRRRSPRRAGPGSGSPPGPGSEET
jgi:hypothetical protein